MKTKENIEKNRYGIKQGNYIQPVDIQNESCVKLFKRIYQNTKYESDSRGRTMIELLAVLALMAILSVIGIMGYSYGMDKWRANTTLNDINLRTVSLMTQAEFDKELNLDEWGVQSTVGYLFDDFGETEDEVFYLRVSGIPKRVCRMMVEVLETKYDLDINNRRLDESATCHLKENNQITVYFEWNGERVNCSPICDLDEICVDGTCVPECQGQSDGTSCSIGFCINEKCMKSCGVNSECAGNEYCADRNTDNNAPNPFVCKSIGSYKTGTVTLSNGAKEEWTAIYNGVSWWDAQNICNRFGKTIVSIEELTDYWDGWAGYNNVSSELAKKVVNALGESWYWSSSTYTSDGTVYQFPFIPRYPRCQIGGAFSREKSGYSVLCRPERGADCSPSCPSGEVCSEGLCVGECQVKQNGETCSIGYCFDGECGKSCSSNNDCENDEYCADRNTDDNAPTPFICKSFGYSKRGMLTLEDGTKEEWAIVSPSMSWWDAQSVCDRLGKKLVSMDDLIISRSTGESNDLAKQVCNVLDTAWYWSSSTYTSGGTVYQWRFIPGYPKSQIGGAYSRARKGSWALCRPKTGN